MDTAATGVTIERVNALNKLILVAGQKTDEQFYEAIFIWPEGGEPLPCNCGDILRNPPLMVGGFSPSVHASVCVRSDLFKHGQRPSKGDFCTIKTKQQRDPLPMRVETVTTGQELIEIACVSRDQAA